ncbi:hypothetical protein ACIHAR_18425 [Streptomyces sp. NPDC052016]|uniref:hypothetical protein n=1 Tax=Streptomyces sp. NPDC052016 TaxID=3365680 RepID=UPI0037D019A0
MTGLAPGTALVPRSAVRHSVTAADESTRVVRHEDRHAGRERRRRHTPAAA